MSNYCLSFLMENPLYKNDYIESFYCDYTDNQLLIMLQEYREFVLNSFSDIQSEIKHEHNKLNICIETFKELPAEDLYKQLVLYLDQVVIPDPLFEITEERSPFNDTMGQLIGLQSDKTLDRQKLINTINYIKCISPLIISGFVVTMPISLIHEAPKEININYSPTSFSDAIPFPILEYYRSIAKVYNLEKCETGLRMDTRKPLTLGTQICVDFPDEIRMNSCMYQYMHQEVIEYDEATNIAQVRMYIPDTISEEAFNHWVIQSINQAANHHFKEKYSELVLAQKNGCMYLSRSPLTARILQMAIEKTSKDAELASMALQLDLPILDQLPITDILEIRNNYGEAFYNFRNELNSKLIGLDSIDDTDAFRHQLDTISYELNNLQVKEVEKEYRKISRTLKLDALALTGSLITSYVTGGITAIGAAGAFVKGISDIGKYYTDVHEHNGLFLWKLNNQAKKYIV